MSENFKDETIIARCRKCNRIVMAACRRSPTINSQLHALVDEGFSIEYIPSPDLIKFALEECNCKR